MKFSKFIMTMAALLVTGSAAAGFDARDTEYNPGGTADVLVKAYLPQGATALQFTMTLPGVFELESDNPILSSTKMQTRVHKENDNTYNYVIYTADNSSIDTSGDYLFGLKLKAKTTSAGGIYSLLFSNIIASTAAGVETHIADYSATLRIIIPMESIALNQSAASLKIGESISLTATIKPTAATDKTITWISSNTTVATVNANGKITAMTLGEAVITAKCGDVSATCAVTVIPTPAESVTLNEHELDILSGETVKLTVMVVPDDATYKDVIWSSSNKDIVTVNQDGIITAVAEGSATIRVTITDDTDIYDECNVRVSKNSSGIDEIVNGNTPYEIYNPTGIKVGDNIKLLSPGYYIVRQGNAVYKIAIK